MGVKITELPGIMIIDIAHPEGVCWVCGKPILIEQGIAIYEDLILPNNWEGEWGGVHTCKECYDLQQTITKPISLADFLSLKRGGEQLCLSF